LRGASERLAQAKKEGEKALRAKGKQGQSEFDALRTENLRKAGVIEELRGADSAHVREKQELLDRAESAEAKAKSLTKELARRVESVAEVRAQNAAVKVLAEQRTAEQEALEQKVKDLVASNGRKDVSARTLKLRIEELQAEISALRSGHSEAAEALVAEAEAARKEAAKVAKSDLARKEERIQLLLAKVSEQGAALSRKERSGGAAASTSRELRWLRGAVRRTLSQLASENAKLRLRLPLHAGASGVHGADRLAHSDSGDGEVAALSTSVMSDLLDDMSGSDADSVVIGGYRSDGDIAAMRMSSNGTSTRAAANANPHQGVLMRRSANEPLGTKLAAKGSDDEDDEFAYALGEEKSSQALRKSGRKGKAPRVGELKKWLASLVEDTGGGMEEKLAAATIAMSAAGQQGHGGVRKIVCVARLLCRLTKFVHVNWL
jgi:HAMP domain-containing protein